VVTAGAFYQDAPHGLGRCCEERENWTAFLSVADEGWGRLLIRIASKRADRHDRQVRKRCRCLAG
jgi:hypothetical protein